MHDNEWIQFYWNGNRYKVKVLFADVVIFMNCDGVSSPKYWSARKWFIQNQEQFNLQGLIDPMSDLYDVSGVVVKTQNQIKKGEGIQGAKKGT